MAQRIVTLCDAHAANDEDAPGATWEVTLRGPGLTKGATWEVDLCEQDGKTLTDLSVMLDTIGRRTAGKAPKPTAARDTSSEPWMCPVAGCGKVPSTRKGLQSHLRTYHGGMSLAKALGRPEPYECPEPGCGFTSARPQGIGAHRKMVHGYSPHAQA